MSQQDDTKLSIPFEAVLKHHKFFNYKVLALFLGILFGVIFVLLSNSQKVFEANVYPKSTKEIHHIQYLKTKDAFLFIFNTNNANLNEIIDFNAMRKEVNLPEKLTYIINRSISQAKYTHKKRHEFLWPEESKILQEMAIYTSNKMDKVLFIDHNGRCFCIVIKN